MRAITKDILHELITTCDDSLRGTRDKALLLVGFASGGRRRSELVNLDLNDLQKISTGYLLTVRKSKTDQAGKGHTVPILGIAASALATWLIQSGIRDGKLFRGVHGRATLTTGMCGDAIHKMIRRRISAIGLDPEVFGAHSLRAGFMTQAAQAGVTLGDAMAFSGHRNSQTAQHYYQHAVLMNKHASKLLEDE
jgi:integrase